MDFLSTQEVAKKWNITRRRVQVLCEEGRLQGAFKVNEVWIMPKDVERPVDKRKNKKSANK
ncbi:MAG: DNA-binding protein [Ruminiclostridium sp.]|nr:DNA-binding protein [Ruminiclostridium sp.]